MRYLVKTPWWLRGLYPRLIWRLPADGNRVYISFDDGPHPEITPWVLDQLKAYDQKASFFLIGKNLEKHPEIGDKILEKGHCIGNHTYDHLSGWKTGTSDYLENFQRCEELLETDLFRPPYGRITRRQAREIGRTHQIIMWDVVSGDFDNSLAAEDCTKNVIRNIRPGSIVVFHDSEKAWPRLEKCLPAVLDYLAQNNLRSEPIA